MFIKNFKQCRRGIRKYKSYHTGNSNAVETPKMQTRAVMSLTQWKLINQLKDYFSKISHQNNMKIMFNKELAKVLQKFQPSIYGTDVVRNFESKNDKNQLSVSTENKTNNNGKVEESSYMLPSMLSGLKIKIGSKEEVVPKETVPKWKTETVTISKNSIYSRTRHIIFSIATAETEESILKRIETLSEHMQQYPESKNCAVKEGAVRLLLNIKRKTQNTNIIAAISESFARLGYNDPVPGKGIRILSIDGGGVRGLLVVEMLKKLEELTGKRTYELFDFICGVSTGAIIAFSIGVLQRDLNELSKIYKDLSTKVFTQSAIWGTGNLVWSHAYYDTALWEKLLQEYMGNEILIKTSRNPKCPKIATLSAVVNQSRVSAYLFRNYALPWRIQSEYIGSNEYQVWQAVRASAAAPTYFEEYKLDNFLHQDGGILYNNPTAVGIHEAKLLWPETPIQCVVSFGTGRIVPMHFQNSQEPQSLSSSWKNKFLKILDSATDTEGVHTVLSDLLPSNVYFRFNPYLTEMLSMAEIDPSKVEQLERDAMMYLRRNEDKFKQAAGVLLQKKTTSQKVMDWLNLQRELFGISFK